MRLNKMSDASQFNYMRAVVVPKDRSSACSRGCVAITGKSHLACDCTAWKVQKWGTPQKTRSHYETESTPVLSFATLPPVFHIAVLRRECGVDALIVLQCQ